MMKVNIYYGGRGLIEDPTIYVINKIAGVLKELRVEVNRYNLYEEKHSMSALTRTLKECDGVVLATTVEWLGIGGLLQQFLDDCWLYADKGHLANVYMLPVVTSMTYGEKEAEYNLVRAWDMLGGISCQGISAYVENHVDFETKPEYGLLIEKSAEELYRSISQKRVSFPCSSNAVKKNVLRKNSIDLTPQESEQLSVYASDDTYVKKQKEDIEELTQLFKKMLGDTDGLEENPKEEEEPEKIEEEVQRAEPEPEEGFLKDLREHFKPGTGITASYYLLFTDSSRSVVVEVKEDEFHCYYGTKEDADVIAKTTMAVLTSMIAGEMTMQKAFMTGVLTAKGNFKTLRSFDEIFHFN